MGFGKKGKRSVFYGSPELDKPMGKKKSVVIESDWDWSQVKVANMKNKNRATWTQEEKSLLDWFLAEWQAGHLPSEPFRLNRWTTVCDTHLFYSRMEQLSKLAGPTSGAMIPNLQSLRELCGKEKSQ